MSPRQPIVRIQLLGSFAVTLPGGRTVRSWGRPPARRLVQLLALSPRHRRTREQVADALFPNLVPARASNAVAKAASMARAAMDTSAAKLLHGDRASVWLDEQWVEVDLDQAVDALRAAVSLPPDDARDAALVVALSHDGELLADEPYAEWAVAARVELDQLRQDARVALARQRSEGRSRGDANSIIEAWDDVAAADPASEEAAVALIEAHIASGRRDLAMRAYLRCVAALRDQLGTEPGPRLQAAYATLEPNAASRGRRPAAERFGRVRLHGRDPLLRRLRRRLATTPGGDGPIVYLTGPAGIGKSVIVRAVAGELERAGWRVLFGAATADDRQAPFAALRVALTPLLGGPEWGEAPLLAETLWGSESGAEAPPAPAAGALARMAIELGLLLDRAADPSPVLLAIDDLQWADPALQAVLRRLATRPDQRRWALVVAARDDEPAMPLPTIGAPRARIEIPPLEPRAMRSAIRASLALDGFRPRTAVIERAVVRSGGNPFFGIELARDAAAAPADHGASGAQDRAVPEAIVSLLRRRFDRLSESARTLLSIAALAGMDTGYDLLLETARRLGPVSVEQAEGVIDELIQARLVSEAADRLVLTHPLLRDAAISTTNAVRRSAVHVAIADALDQMEDRLHPPDRQLAARHRLAAFAAAKLPATAAAAADAGFREGQRARRIYADDAALLLLEMALAAFETLPTEGRSARVGEAAAAWLTVGHIRLDADDAAGAEDAYRRALPLTQRETEAARAWSALGGVPYRRGHLREALHVYHEGIRQLAGGDPLATARLESDAAWVLQRLGRASAALRILRRVAPILATSAETHVRCRLRDRLGIALRSVGRDREALEAFDAGVADAEALGDERELMVLCTHRAPLLSALGRHEDAVADATRAAAIAEMAQDRYSRAVVHWVTAEVLERNGALHDAIAERDAEIAILLSIDNPRNLAIAQTHRGVLHTRLGNAADAAAATKAARAAMRRARDARLTADLEGQLADAGAPLEPGKSSGTATS